MVEGSTSLSTFIFKEKLGICPSSKKIYLLGTFPDNKGLAIVILEKTPFADSDVPGILEESNKSQPYFQNDIYSSFCHFPNILYCGLKTTLIYPASEQLIKKYTPESNRIIEETYDLYVKVTEPYITKNHPPPEWLYNILDHKAESDRIIYEETDPETGFILLPDLKWDGSNLEAFYVQALPYIRGLKSLRDLSGKHLPLLRNIAVKGPKVIGEKYGIAKNQLLIYFHYLPSFYHIHVHFKVSNVDGNSAGMGCYRAHLLSTVIQNLELCPDYYQRATLPISLKQSDELLIKLIKNVSSNGSSAPAEIM